MLIVSITKWIQALLAFVVTLGSVAARAETAQPVVLRQAQPFPLQEVRLLAGPFRDAMLRDEKYLLSLDPDRFLFNFRQNFGLKSSAHPYGGWDAPDCEQRGAMLGHYLTACSQMYASTGDSELKRRVDQGIAGLAECQSNSVSAGFHEGYLSAFPESHIDRVENHQRVWAPWYALHKIMAGLLDSYQLCGNAQALQVLTNMAGWVKFRVDRIPPEQMQRSLDTEFGGMNEVLANLYAVTGNPDHLRLAQAFNQNKIFDPLARGEDQLNGLHANTQIPKMIGAVREYELTGDSRYHKIAQTFWDSVALRRSYVIGGHSDREHFFPVSDFAKHLSPDTCETCNTYNMLRLTRLLFALEPDAAKMDFYERGLFNHILASQDPQTGMFVYLMSLKPGHFKTYSTPEDSFWCCVGTGMENHSKYGDTIFFHDDAALYVNLFIASELSWREKNLIVRQETGFPESDTTRLTFRCEKPVRVALKIRRPSWAQQPMTVRVNGKKQEVGAEPGSYVALDREWHDGDHVEIRLPMQLHTEPLPSATNRVALLYGPIVLAGELGTNGMPMPYARTQTALNKVADPQVPAFVGRPNDLLRRVRPVSGKSLTFRTHGVGRPDDVTLIPFYRMHHQRYSVYWELLSRESWQERAKRLASAKKTEAEAGAAGSKTKQGSLTFVMAK